MIKQEAVSKFYLNYRLYIFPAVVALSSLILIIFVIYPQTVKLITNQQVQQQIANKSTFLETKAQVLENYDPEDLNRKVAFTLSSYPTDKDFASALALLQNLTSQSGFNTVSIVLGSSISKEAGDKSYNLKLDILGPPILLPNLLSRIEDSPRLIRVSGVETTVGRDPQGAIISLSVDVLYSSAPTEFGSVDSPLPELSQKDEEILVKLARLDTLVSQPTTTTQLGPRGKANPFE